MTATLPKPTRGELTPAQRAAFYRVQADRLESSGSLALAAYWRGVANEIERLLPKGEAR